MSPPQLPEILKKRLVFGDEQQIAAIRNYERKMEEYFGGEGEKRWAVHIEVEGTITVHVTAKTREEAEEKAQNEADFDLGDFDVCYNAVEVRSKGNNELYQIKPKKDRHETNQNRNHQRAGFRP